MTVLQLSDRTFVYAQSIPQAEQEAIDYWENNGS